MSKKLLKILALCIFVTLIPVAIVASALMVTQAAPYTIVVDLKGEQENLESYSKSLTISVNEKLKEGNKVNAKETDKVLISFESEAYDITGFYSGEAETITEDSDPLQEGNASSYTFEVKGSTNITIWLTPKTYILTFDAKGIESSKFTFSQELPKIEAENFVGWSIQNSEDGRVYTDAIFENSGNYTLIPVYSDSYNFNFSVRDENGSYIYLKDKETGVVDGFVENIGTYIKVGATIDFDPSQTLYDYYLGSYENYEFVNESDKEFNKQNFSIHVYYDTNIAIGSFVIRDDVNLTFSDIIDKLIEQGVNQVTILLIY